MAAKTVAMLADTTEDRVDRLGATRHMNKQLAERADQIAPRPAIKIQTLQRRLATRGNPASLAAMHLPTCRIKQLHINVLRHRQESLVAATEARRAGDGAKFLSVCRHWIQFDRYQKPVCRLGRARSAVSDCRNDYFLRIAIAGPLDL